LGYITNAMDVQMIDKFHLWEKIAALRTATTLDFRFVVLGVAANNNITTHIEFGLLINAVGY